ncbi:hypothetical protein EMIHUDRAFT_201912 [Emiliania huxleyi CCMP1516]|uniref:Uncharacterized protein n=2 Tax=Emiliania huxleyi TaxID=2903 RepID=A0A0D3KEP7_EMIH1|nr:hypothetical protein EMIHUDRAFT_201904 [Emiliania huxleyi CCMP1516]XP_005786668.1 hypothetical protein EMIHUDRAFT_201912 [Emiliania huxleyi CCMP1516]EOD34232.1 hypothetical protein EMIHUDRAFT_201904 [Emiliania huxleyi CCMP1516]EOD34239.1 hypothetical protein EMIHUDRAFT_201912 [Emiliania huxleyi CCMP1516]|eukprot:XP_005786661.1 hypothetical protein EMIHUDRAFT_201904 [Emiliania huxleyi CCMP1516]
MADGGGGRGVAHTPGLALAVEALHAEYERALVEVFDQYKAAAGYPDAELTVL